jgi:integrase
MGRITNFLNQYSKANTRRGYQTAVRAFFSFIYNEKRGKEVSMDVFEDLADRYFLETRDYADDVISFVASLNTSPPKTARVYVAGVKEFLLFYEIELRELDLRRIKKRLPKGGAVTVEKIMDPEMIRKILHHCGLMMRALILLLVSSGLRKAEVLSLDIRDIDVSKVGDIGHISVRGMNRSGGGAKGGIQRYSYCSIEATDSIREWLKKRDEYLRSTLNRGTGIGQRKSMDDTRLFPISSSTLNTMWLNALTGADLVSRDSVTKYLQIHIHMTRKFFSSQLRLGVPDDIVEGLMGHSGYLSNAYRRYNQKQVEDLYRTGEPYVTIQMTDEIRELRTNTDKKMQAHAEMMESLVRRNMNLESRVNDLENLIKNIEKTSEMIENK